MAEIAAGRQGNKRTYFICPLFIICQWRKWVSRRNMGHFSNATQQTAKLHNVQVQWCPVQLFLVVNIRRENSCSQTQHMWLQCELRALRHVQGFGHVAVIRQSIDITLDEARNRTDEMRVQQHFPAGLKTFVLSSWETNQHELNTTQQFVCSEQNVSLVRHSPWMIQRDKGINICPYFLWEKTQELGWKKLKDFVVW